VTPQKSNKVAAWSCFTFRVIISQANRPPFAIGHPKMAKAKTLKIDESIRSAIQYKTDTDQEYWSFRGRARRDAAHALIQYPAMMVPQMQGELIDIVLSASPDISTLFDPFVGSGTILTEAMRCRKNFIGFDINPLAVLASQTKAGPFFVSALEEKCTDVLARISSDKKTSIDIVFPGQEKWFKKIVSQDLSRIRRAIMSENSKWARRFFWLSLAECVRRCSNSRTSTFKLHIKDPATLKADSPNVLRTFGIVITENFASYKKQADQLKASLNRGTYSGDVTIELTDTASTKPIHSKAAKVDLLVTSPPYGDNTTTVPYGQFSFLALQWIDLQDIDSSLSADILKTTHEIDSRSLGGSIRGADESAEYMSSISSAFAATYGDLRQRIATIPHSKRLAAFCYDLDQSIQKCSSYVRSGGYMVWTLGNRSTGGLTVPLAEIVKDSLVNSGAVPVTSILRSIPL
jgi:hypothetical protein